MFLKIKNVPNVWWSSNKPLNFKPKISTFLFLCFGLTLFGLGEGLLIVSFTGASPWIFLDQKPGIGTVLNALIISVMIDLCINFVPTPTSYIYQIILAICSVVLVGLGGGIYLVANLGPGPRDGLMIGLQKKTNLPIALVRALLEITVVTIGWYLGGVVGIGTLLFAFGIGPCVALGLYLVNKLFN